MENNLFKNIPKETKEFLKLIGRISDNLSVSSFVAGGFVRDILLRRENLDLDIVVETNAIDFAQHLVKVIPGKLITHKKFGTATLVLDKFRIDIATARKESYSASGALPDVYMGTITDDLFRRDFTINAMAASLNSSSFGQLLDLFGGLNDLKHRKIRILHDLSFVDDPTRILRAIRFKERFNFMIEEKTVELLRQALESNMLSKVSLDRILDELIHILKEDNPPKQIFAVNRIYGFSFIDPKIKINSSAALLLKKARQEISWFKNSFSQRRKLDSWLIYFIILLDSLSYKAVQRIINRFNFKRGEIKRIVSYKKIGKTQKILSRTRLGSAEIFKILEPLSYEVILLIKIKSFSLTVKKRIALFFKMLNGLKLKTRGADLKKLGLKPGRDFKLILEKALYKKAEGKLRTKKQELSFIKQLIHSTAPNPALKGGVQKRRSVSTLRRPRAKARGLSNGLI